MLVTSPFFSIKIFGFFHIILAFFDKYIVNTTNVMSLFRSVTVVYVPKNICIFLQSVFLQGPLISEL